MNGKRLGLTKAWSSRELALGSWGWLGCQGGVLPVHNTTEVSLQSCMRCGPRALVAWSTDWRGGMSFVEGGDPGIWEVAHLDIEIPC